MIRAIHRAALVALLFPCAGALGQRLVGPSPSGPVPMPQLLDTTGLFNQRYARVGDDLFIAGQPTEKGLRLLHDQGVTTIVNLRTPEEMAKIGFDEAALAARLGMKYAYVPVRGNAQFPYAPATVDSLTNAMTTARGKVLLHCTVAWRASHLWAAYLIQVRKLNVDSALANARAINLMDDMAMTPGRQPVEDFLNRDLTQLRRKKSE